MPNPLRVELQATLYVSGNHDRDLQRVFALAVRVCEIVEEVSRRAERREQH
jgi:hypothetical protein